MTSAREMLLSKSRKIPSSEERRKQALNVRNSARAEFLASIPWQSSSNWRQQQRRDAD